MSQAFVRGLAEGATAQFEKAHEARRKREEERAKARAQVESLRSLGVLDAVASLSQPEPVLDRQTLSDRLEQQVGSRMLPPGTQPFNLQGATEAQIPLEIQRGEEQARATRLLNALSSAGIKTTDVGGIEFGSRYGGTIPLMTFNPDTGEYFSVGTAPRGTQFRNVRPSLESEVERQRMLGEARGGGYATGQLGVKGLEQTQANAITGSRAVVRSVDNMIGLFDRDPGLFERASTPGARAVFIGDEMVKEVELWRNNLLNYKAFSEGGKQLTQTELARTIATLTSFIRGESVSRKALLEMKQKAQENLSLLEGSYSRSQLGNQSTSSGSAGDMSGLSDDELRAIMGGQ